MSTSLLPLTRFELIRTLRNPTSIFFAIGLPVVMYLIFGNNASYANERVGHGNVAAVVMLCMALYGAMIAATGAGASVAAERSMGWSRQLRLTPVSSVTYIVAKAVASLVLSLVAVLGVAVVGLLGSARMTGWVWATTLLIAWLGSTMFTAFGLFIGFLVRSSNAMRFVGPAMMIVAFLGNLLVPITPDSTLDRIARWTPMYGLRDLTIWPMQAPQHSAVAIAGFTGWTLIFVLGAAAMMRRDTGRVATV